MKDEGGILYLPDVLNRPYGTGYFSRYLAPSDKSLGYSHMLLRGKDLANDKAFRPDAV